MSDTGHTSYWLELENCREKLVACKRRNAELEARKEHASKLLQYVGIIKNEDVQEKIDEAFQVLNSRRLNTYLGELIESALAEGYNQGQTEERERCRARIIRLTTQRNRLLKAITVVVNSVGMDSDMRIVKTLNQTVQEVREAVADDN